MISFVKGRVARLQSYEMKSRRKAREAALQALYQCDTIADYSESAISLFFEVFHSAQVMPTLDEDEEGAPQQDPPVREHLQFSHELIDGVVANLQVIDQQLSLASTHWSLGRMARVDRNILRIATYEIMFRPEIPLSVTMNEAIEVAKRFGSDDSPMFVNGVLDHVAKLLAQEDKLGQKVRGSVRRTGT